MADAWEKKLALGIKTGVLGKTKNNFLGVQAPRETIL